MPINPTLGATLMPMEGVLATTPEQKAQNVQGWKGFLERFKSDPTLQAGVVQMGISLMQPQMPGQSVGGHVGQSLASGMNQMAMIEAMRRKQQDADRKETREDARATAYNDYLEGMIDAQKEGNRISQQRLEGESEERLANATNRTEVLKLQQAQLEQATRAAAAAEARAAAADNLAVTGGELGARIGNLAKSLVASGQVKTPDEAYILASQMLQPRGASKEPMTKEQFLLGAVSDVKGILDQSMPGQVDVAEAYEAALKNRETLWNSLHPQQGNVKLGQTFTANGMKYTLKSLTKEGYGLAETEDGKQVMINPEVTQKLISQLPKK